MTAHKVPEFEQFAPPVRLCLQINIYIVNIAIVKASLHLPADIEPEDGQDYPIADFCKQECAFFLTGRALFSTLGAIKGRNQMATIAEHVRDQKIPGVRRAEQRRSRVLQGKFAEAGRKAILETRLDDLSIPALAKAAGSSVGGFYSRFESKEAFFEFLRLQMLTDHMTLYEEALAPERFEGKTAHDVTKAFVDVMIRIFNGPWRGVLREAYSVIPDNPESWAPMKARGQYVRQRVTGLYRPIVAAPEGLDERVSIAVQLLFSALNNEMMNPNLAFSIRDPKFRHYLIAAFDALVIGETLQPKDTTP